MTGFRAFPQLLARASRHAQVTFHVVGFNSLDENFARACTRGIQADGLGQRAILQFHALVAQLQGKRIDLPFGVSFIQAQPEGADLPKLLRFAKTEADTLRANLRFLRSRNSTGCGHGRLRRSCDGWRWCSANQRRRCAKRASLRPQSQRCRCGSQDECNHHSRHANVSIYDARQRKPAAHRLKKFFRLGHGEYRVFLFNFGMSGFLWGEWDEVAFCGHHCGHPFSAEEKQGSKLTASSVPWRRSPTPHLPKWPISQLDGKPKAKVWQTQMDSSVGHCLLLVRGRNLRVPGRSYRAKSALHRRPRLHRAWGDGPAHCPDHFVEDPA